MGRLVPLILGAALAIAGCKKSSPVPQEQPKASAEPRPQQSPPPAIRAKRTSTPPTLDGVLDEPMWQQARPTSAFVNTMTSAPAAFSARARLAYDDTHLYFGVEVADDNLRAPDTDHDDHLWEKDCVELMVDPDGDGRNYYELQVSPRGVVFDTRYDTRRRPQPFGHVDWQSELKHGVKVEGTLDDDTQDTGYTVEAALPLSAVGESTPRPGQTWRINFYVMDKRTEGQRAASWSPPLVGDFHVPARFGTLSFGNVRPTMQRLDPARRRNLNKVRKIDSSEKRQLLKERAKDRPRPGEPLPPRPEGL